MFVFWHEHQLWYLQTTGKNYYQEKKGTVLWPAIFFGGFKFQSEKNFDPKKKRYSCLADGWHKSQITLCHVKIQTPIITKLEKNMSLKKKGTVVWLSVGAQNTKHNTHRQNNQQDELCHPTLQRLCPLYLTLCL